MNTTAGSDRNAEPALSAAASETLNELLVQHRAEILNAAQRTSEDNNISSVDVQRAYFASTASSMNRDLVRIYELESARRRYIKISTMLAGLAASLMSGVSLSLLVNQESDSFISIFSGVGLVAAFVTLGGLIMSRASDQRSKVRLSYPDFNVVLKTDGDYNSSQVDKSEAEAIGQYLKQWRRTEGRLRNLAGELSADEAVSARRRPIGAIVDQLVSSGVLDKTAYSRLRSALAVRNAIVHGGAVPPDEVRNATRQLVKLDHEIDELLRQR